MIRFFRYLLLVLAGLFGFAGHLSATTVYPLQLNAQIIPPYSNCLGDMVAGNVTSIRVTGLLRDLKAHSYNVGIGMQVYQGSQLKFATKTNHTEVVTNNTIHNFNLKDLFSPNNITGRYDGDGYCLKEGGYEFVFQAFDGGNARLPLSEPVRIHVYLSQAEPPRIIAPANGECVNYNAPVNFVWMEGAVTSYNPNRSYRLEIVELPEQTENFDAKSYINNNSTKITIEGIPGNLNFYTFQNTAGKLVKGRSYLWRVQLYDKTQMVSDARTIYSTSSAVANGGYSEVYTFKYTNCDPFGQRAEDQIDESKKPEIIRVDSSEALSTVVWKNDPENFPCGYIVCFNRADDTLSNWARVEVGPTDSTYTFKNVENGVQYLTHIIGIVDCREDGTKTLSANSDNGSFTLPVPEEQECSTTIDGLTSQYSVENLKVNDYFTANDRNIKINKIERFIEGGDTTFSGEGQVLCPWFPTISLTTKFEKVKINRNYELVKGVVYVPTDSSNCGFFDLDEMMNDEYTGDGPAEEMSDKFKEYTSTDEIPEGELGVVNGELYAKVNGQAVDLGKVVPASDYEKKIQKGNIDAKLGIVDFEAVSYWNPPYDGDRENYSGDIDKYYTNYSTSSGNYTVPWFAMASGSTSDVKARLQINDNFPLDKLKFVCLTSSQAVELNAKKDQDFGSYTYYKLPIFGGEGETSLNLYAVATDNDGYPITLGRAQILSMPKYEQSVVLIPVKREASSIDQASIEKKLNEIYSPLGITYKVTVADKFDSEELDFMKDGLEVEGSGYLSTETNAMKQLKNLYAQSHTIEKDAAYIFVCPKAKYDGAEVKGDMPRSGQTGYVFSTAEKYDDGWTVAHELGHGLYSFDHTFPNKKQGTTDNLMDYANGTNLKVWQWNLLYSHKNFTIPFLESDEDGMFAPWIKLKKRGIIIENIPIEHVAELYGPDKNLVPFIDHGGDIVMIPKNATDLSFIGGALNSFCLKNSSNISERWIAFKQNEKFIGYFVQPQAYKDRNGKYTNSFENLYGYNQYREVDKKVYYVTQENKCDSYKWSTATYKKENSTINCIQDLSDLPIDSKTVTNDIIINNYDYRCLPKEYQSLYYYLITKYSEKLKEVYTYDNNYIQKYSLGDLVPSETYKQHLFLLLDSIKNLYIDCQNNEEIKKDENILEYTFNSNDPLALIFKLDENYDYCKNGLLILKLKFDEQTCKEFNEGYNYSEDDNCNIFNTQLVIKNFDEACTKEYAIDLKNGVDKCCVDILKNIPCNSQFKYIKKLLEGGIFSVTSDDYEKAILKIMNCISEDNYILFYKFLEENNCEVLNLVLDKFHDVGILGDNNYTLFLQKLISMYHIKLYPTPNNYRAHILLDKLSMGDGVNYYEDYKIEENSEGYYKVSVTPFFTSYDFNHADTHMSYNGGDGINIEKTTLAPNTLYDGFVSPLTPIMVFQTNNELDLVKGALNGYYVVPMVFLKYRNQKIINNNTITFAEVASDLLTIYCSLGTATPYITTIKSMRKAAMLKDKASKAIKFSSIFKKASTTAGIAKDSKITLGKVSELANELSNSATQVKEAANIAEKLVPELNQIGVKAQEIAKASDVLGKSVETATQLADESNKMVKLAKEVQEFNNLISGTEKLETALKTCANTQKIEEALLSKFQDVESASVEISKIYNSLRNVNELTKTIETISKISKSYETVAKASKTKEEAELFELFAKAAKISDDLVSSAKKSSEAAKTIEELASKAKTFNATNKLANGSKLEEVKALLSNSEWAKLATIESYCNFSAIVQGVNAGKDLLGKVANCLEFQIDCEILNELLDNISIAIDIFTVADGIVNIWNTVNYKQFNSDWVDKIDKISLKKTDFVPQGVSTVLATWHILYVDFDNVVNIGNTSKEDYEKLKERVGEIEKELIIIYEKAK